MRPSSAHGEPDNAGSIVAPEIDARLRALHRLVGNTPLLAIDVRIRRQFQHPVQADRRVIRSRLFADESGPHGIVKFGIRMGHGLGRVGVGKMGSVALRRGADL